MDAILGFLADFLWLIDVNAGGFRLKKGQGILHRGIISAMGRVWVGGRSKSSVQRPPYPFTQSNLWETNLEFRAQPVTQ